MPPRRIQEMLCHPWYLLYMMYLCQYYSSLTVVTLSRGDGGMYTDLNLEDHRQPSNESPKLIFVLMVIWCVCRLG